MARAPQPTLVIKAGTTVPAVRERHGDFERWFIEGIGPSPERFVVLDVPGGERPGAPTDYAGVVVTGSSSSLTAPEPWTAAVLDFLNRAVDADVPTLGVCYGHQLLAVALGGRVEKNPKGREIGTVEVALTEAGQRDPLFEGLPPIVEVQATHQDVVTELPAGAVLLASNELCANQAFAFGKSVRTVQWHPEFSLEVLRGYIEGRASILESEGIDPDALWVRARHTDSGARILQNFRRAYLEAAKGA